jgi:4-amino-4-deoxy-L-arabinose transferase-like glycosyltransferase
MTSTTHPEKRWGASTPKLGALLDLAVASHLRAVLVLVGVVLLAILPGFFTIPPTDRDESRFAQATKQMIESGDYVDIRFQDDVRYKKPVGIYWLQAAAVRTAGALGVPRAMTTISIYRIPSLLGAIGSVCLTYWAALAFVSRRAAILAGVMMATCLLLGIEGRLAKTDAVLLSTMVAAMGALARVYLPEQRKALDPIASWTIPVIFWTALAAGVLVKGPVILMFVALCAASLSIIDRSGRWLLALQPLVGVAWFAVLVLPWFVAIFLHSGSSFFAESIVHDLLSKVAESQETHGAPPGYYLLLFWVTFWPGAVLTGAAIPAIWAARREPGAKFLLAWVVPSWVVLELVVTKLPHYVLPAYPAIAILIAGIVDAGMLLRTRWLSLGTIWWFLMPLLAGLAGVLALVFIGGRFGFLIWPVIAACLVLGLVAWQLYDADGPAQSFLRAAGASVLLGLAVFGLVVPALTPLFPSVALARVLRDSGCRDPVAASAGFHEPSLVFLAGTATRLTDSAGAAEFLRGGECRFAFIEARQELSFAQHAEALGVLYSPVRRVEGFNSGITRSQTIAVFRSGGPQ